MKHKSTKGIIITKDIFEYLINNKLNEQQFCELMKSMYYSKFGELDK